MFNKALVYIVKLIRLHLLINLKGNEVLNKLKVRRKEILEKELNKKRS